MPTNWTAENIPDLTGKIAIVTGANSGIGYEMARALARKEAMVILACRNKDKGEAAVRQIAQEYPEAKAELMPLDLSDLASVRRFAGEFTSHYDGLDILINNAGIMAIPFGKTADGFEKQFGTNHLGHFALTGLLLDLILRTPRARVVTVSSGGHRFGKIDFDNLNAEKELRPAKGLCPEQTRQSPLYVRTAKTVRGRRSGYHRRRSSSRLDGDQSSSSLADDSDISIHSFGQKPKMGALPTLYAATAPDVQGGDYYGPSGWRELRGYPDQGAF